MQKTAMPTNTVNTMAMEDGNDSRGIDKDFIVMTK